MKVVKRKLADLVPYEKNPRINEAAVEYVAASLKEFGWQQPIVIDNNNVIVAGHTRYKAALKLGLTEAECKIASELTPEQIKAYRLADNKVAEISAWDYDMLKGELDALDFDMASFGFNVDMEEITSPMDDDDSASDESEESNGYNITYEIAFNDEDEQERWHNFLRALKKEYPDEETIAERILVAVDEWMNNHEA